jgi:hypothetical protein
MVLGLVIINNHYFMPSLQLLSHKLRLTDDVAGACKSVRTLLHILQPSTSRSAYLRHWISSGDSA